MTIIEYLTANPCSQFSAIMKGTDLKRPECSRLLAELKKSGAIIMTGAKRTARYTVAKADLIEAAIDRIVSVPSWNNLDGAA